MDERKLTTTEKYVICGIKISLVRVCLYLSSVNIILMCMYVIRNLFIVQIKYA